MNTYNPLQILLIYNIYIRSDTTTNRICRELVNCEHTETVEVDMDSHQIVSKMYIQSSNLKTVVGM